jgi:hypothetical protein
MAISKTKTIFTAKVARDAKENKGTPKSFSPPFAPLEGRLRRGEKQDQNLNHTFAAAQCRRRTRRNTEVVHSSTEKFWSSEKSFRNFRVKEQNNGSLEWQF